MIRPLSLALAMLGAGVLAAQDKNPQVVMTTSAGVITLEIYQDKSPLTAKNFLQYVDEKHYDGTLFHRIIPSFMIQGGGYLPGLKEKETRKSIKNEASTNRLSNLRGTIAMARRDDPDSASAQWFINVVHNGYRLDPSPDSAGYAVFGRVVEGMDVVDAIKMVKTGARDVPVEDVVIRTIRRK